MHQPAGGWLQAGRVGRPHGLDGSFYVRDASPRLLEVGTVVLIGERQSRIVRRAGADEQPIVRLDGYAGRAAAEALNGQQLLVERTETPELEADEWWTDDLVGCAVHDGDHDVGMVVRVLTLPSCDVLEVVRPGAGELLVPLVSDAVRTVDVAGKQIDVDLGFLGAQ